ncbi:MAG: response regulator [Cyclobacteriaceae bacterium]
MQNKEVLIVDDEQEICMLLSNIVKKAGREPLSVNSIAEAKSQIKKHIPDTVFLDVNLPDGVGLDLIPVIKTKKPKAKIIVISAHDGVEEQQEALNIGADQFIGKPFTSQQVLHSLS